ncbi:glial cell line-derived neurotrophic factor-like [Limanda limanda]|uniref:glial cell line-derived neurotrophic factor-like n=1 Tax=Limanda limanda TaxID=27771 RepID=UPI0029C6C8EB|nr:glial cell line-derived neurotrophic factor-like [Limanda limanda]
MRASLSASGISHSPVTLPCLSLPPVKGHKVSGSTEGQALWPGAFPSPGASCCVVWSHSLIIASERRFELSGQVIKPSLSGARERATRKHFGERWFTQTRDTLLMTSVCVEAVQVLLWVLLSLLPLVEGAHMKAGAASVVSDSGHAVGLLGGQEERQPPVTLPEVVEDEEQEDDSDPYSTWHALYDPFVIDEVDDHPSSRWAGRSPRSSDPTEPKPTGSQKKKKKRKRKDKEEVEETGKRDKKGRGKKRRPKQSSRDCRVEKREMKVRDLGLGFDSDEIVLFKFCVGSCQSSRTNYDLALKALLENGSVPRRKVSSHPCCRPDRYESVSFMDAQTTWRTIQSLSAASCMCMG